LFPLRGGGWIRGGRHCIPQILPGDFSAGGG
jgi:hypothetical protein